MAATKNNQIWLSLALGMYASHIMANDLTTSALRPALRMTLALNTPLNSTAPIATFNQQQPATNTNIGAKHTHAIEVARAGNTDEALVELAQLRSLAPNDSKILADYIVVLTWEKRNIEAVKASESHALQDLPNYALTALAHAARDIGDTNKALLCYEALIQQNPEKVDYQVARALVLIDAKQYDQAHILLAQLKEKSANSIEVLNAEVYLGKQSNHFIQVLDASERLLALNPKNAEAASNMMLAANTLGASSKAAELMQQYGLSIDSIQQIKANQAAAHVRWGEYDPINPAQPYIETDKALKEYDALCQCDWFKLDLTKIELRRLVYDRMLALRNRNRNADVIAHYDALVKSGFEIPIYALNAAGDAYLALREPEKALAIYNTILTKEPDNNSALIDKFYTLIELEEFTQAKTLINQVAASQPSYLNRSNNPIVRQNDKKFQADSAAFYGLAYADDLTASENKFSQLLSTGPSNPEVKNDLATIWRWRGWLTRAESAYRANLIADKVINQTKFGLANTELDLREWQSASQAISAMNGYLDANDPTLKALNRRWELHNKKQFSTDFVRSSSTGNNAAQSAIGSSSNALNAALYSAPFNDNYRAFISTNYASDTFTEGVGKVIAPNVGLEYRSRDWRLTSQLGNAMHDGNGLAGAATAEYRLDDYWNFNAAIDMNSQQMPLRGQRVGISANDYALGASYRWNELLQVSAGLNVLDMSDGNVRQAINTAVNARVYSTPHYKANVLLGASASHNTQQGGSYFNPESDTSLNAALEQDWMTWRRYDRSLTQQLKLGVGNYWQQNFGSNATWAVSYSHDWQFDNQFELVYGIARTSQPYDGAKEMRNDFFGHINLLF